MSPWQRRHTPATGDRPTAGARRRTHGLLPPRLARPAWRGPLMPSVSGGARTVRAGARLSGDEPEAGAGRWGCGGGWPRMAARGPFDPSGEFGFALWAQLC